MIGISDMISVINILRKVIDKYHPAKKRKREDDLRELIKEWLICPPANINEPIKRYKFIAKKDDASKELRKLIDDIEELDFSDCFDQTKIDEVSGEISRYIFGE